MRSIAAAISVLLLVAPAVMAFQPVCQQTSTTNDLLASIVGASQTLAPPLMVNNMAAGEETCKDGDKFMYNLQYGPPNRFRYLTGDQSGPGTAISNLFWTANITCGAAFKNGYPLGCCQNAHGANLNTPLIAGCQACMNNAALPTTFPTYYNGPTAAISTTAGAEGTTSTDAAFKPIIQPWTPITGATDDGLAPNQIQIGGNGVNTLNFPAASTSQMAAGIYTFSLWAESLCGKAMSKSVNLAARCPPPPTIRVVVRPSAWDSPLSTEGTGAAAYISATTNVPLFIDASCSMPYMQMKGPESQWQASSAYSNLYAIQMVSFSAKDTSVTSFSAFVNSANKVAPTGGWSTHQTVDVTTPIGRKTGYQYPAGVATPFNTWPYGTWVRVGSSSTQTIYITVSDGCSASQTSIMIKATCSCTPAAQASYMPTIWTNQMPNDASRSGSNKVMASGAAMSFTLSAAKSTDIQSGGGDMSYDWSFFSWAPDYSDPVGPGMSKYYEIFQAGNGNSKGESFPPSPSSACANPKTGETPLACGATGWGLSATKCCFSTSDMYWDIGAYDRPEAGKYKYAVFRTVFQNSVTAAANQLTMNAQMNKTDVRSWTSGTTRENIYSFMRLAGACDAPNKTGAPLPWMTVNSTLTPVGNPYVRYHALPSFLQSGQNGNQNFNDIPEMDFNNFPNVAPGVTDKPTLFRPTTQCSGWLRQTIVIQRKTTLQSAANYTRACSGERDLLLCQIMITTTYPTTNPPTNRWNVQTSSLKISSFGSCKGQWQFQLAVNDQCSTGYDYFDLKVGCNRAPSVVAGCSNTQTWVGDGASSANNKFNQITLDGRASWDADNFGDSFYSIADRTDAFPSCSTCANGGLGTFGLTYAWAFVSAPNNMYTATVGGPCPVTAGNMMATCEHATYCSAANDFSYPTIDMQTSKWTSSQTWPGRQGGRAGNININNPMNNQPFGPSTQGDANLFTGWSMAMQTANTASTSMWNRLPAISNIASPTSGQAGYWTMNTAPGVTDLPLFPMFRKDCAPTQLPMFLKTFDSTTMANVLQAGAVANSQLYQLYSGPLPGGANANTNLWKIYQQLQHQGNVAYIVGLKLEGDYTVRLYAFDGCSVGHGDVSFTTQCPSLTFSDWTKFPTFVKGLNATYQNGDSSVTQGLIFPYTDNRANPGEFEVPYTGVPSVTLSGTASVYKCMTNTTTNQKQCTTLVRQCTVSQKPDSPIFSDVRTMIVHGAAGTSTPCSTLIYNPTPAPGTSSWLDANDEGYRLTVTVGDNCNNRMLPVSQDFGVTCQNSITIMADPAQNFNGTTFPQYVLPYTFPGGAAPSRNNNPQGKFKDVPIKLYGVGYDTTQASRPEVNNGIVWTFKIYWSNQKPAQPSLTGAQNAFVAQSPEVGTLFASTAKGAIVGNLPAGVKPIQFPAISPNPSDFLSWGYLPEANAMQNGPFTSPAKNVVLSSTQRLFNCPAGQTGANCRINPFMWEGTYKIVATAQLRATGANNAIANLPYSGNFGNVITCAKSAPVEWFVTLQCGTLESPLPHVLVTCAAGGQCNNLGAFTGTSLTTKPTNAAGGEAPLASMGVDVAFQKTTATYCANGIQANAYTPYCNTPYGPNAAGNVKTGRWPTMYFTAPGWAGWAATTATESGFSTLSFVPSYKNAVTIGANCSGTPGTPAPNCNTPSSWQVVNQNPLLLSPTAYANIPRLDANGQPMTFAYPVTNRAVTKVALGLPGTWQIDLYGTNGCANTTTSAGTNPPAAGPGFELHYYCYRNDMPNADLTVSVRDFRETALTDREQKCSASNPPNPPVAVGQVQSAGPWRARRRLLSKEETEEDASVSTRQISTSFKTTCDLNAGMNLLSGATLDFPHWGTPNQGSTRVSNVLGLSPNFQSYVPIYFNSYAIAPGYSSGTVATDTRNFNGMGTVFPNSPLKYGITHPEPFSYQGKFDNVRLELASTFNVAATAWFAFGNKAWTDNYACSGGGSCITQQAPPAPATNTPYSSMCSLTKTADIFTQTSAYNVNNWPPSATLGAATPVGQDVTFRVYGCNDLGMGMSLKGNGMANSVASVALINQKFDVECTCLKWDNVQNNRDCSNCEANTALAAGSMPSVSYFSTSAAPAGAVTLGGAAGLVTTKAATMDFVAFVWNGPIGASCYDYRAVRVQARCNQLLGASGATNPTMSIDGNQIAANAVAKPISWLGSKFQTVELSATIQYNQCGQYGTTDCGSSDSSGNPAPGNLYSLVYRWYVVDSPMNSWYGMAQKGVNVYEGAMNLGTPMKHGAPMAMGDLFKQTYHRQNTQLVNTTTNTVILVNHGFNTPKTCLRPDVEGTYQVQLQIDDGCSVWQGQVVSVQASCNELPSPSEILDGLAFFTPSLKAEADKANKAVTGKVSRSADNTFPLSVVGNVYERVTIQTTKTPNTATDYYTYAWTIVSPYSGNTMKLTNNQGNVVSFVPEQTLNQKSGYESTAAALYNVTLSISSNCWQTTGKQMRTYKFQVSITCDTKLEPTDFQFGNTRVRPWQTTITANGGATPAKWWTIDTNANPTGQITPNYYKDVMTMPPNGASNLNTAACSTDGPFCSPSSTITTGGIPTILYGGSTDDNVNFANAGWQAYYFSVPGTLNPKAAKCKVLRTYWMLTGYQNSVNFYPTYTPSPVAQPLNVTCFPTQHWRLTIKKTPCEPCAQTGPDSVQDVCTFSGYNTYWMKNDALTKTVVSNYNPPRFYTKWSGATGTLIQSATVSYTAPTGTTSTPTIPGGGRCIYGSGAYTQGGTGYAGRMANYEPTAIAMGNWVHNCLVSGRGREIDVKVGTRAAAYQCDGTLNKLCYMDEVEFVPQFPGPYTLEFSIVDGCGPPVIQDITIQARCATVPIKPKILATNIISYYYCKENNPNKPWGSASVGVNSNDGAFQPKLLSDLIETPDYTGANSQFKPTDKVSTGAGGGLTPPEPSKQCAVTTVAATIKNCTDIRNQLKNDASLVVDTSSSNGDKFKACCTCLYGQNTINVFSVPGSGTPTRSNPDTKIPGTHNVLALNDAQYSSNWNLLIGLVAPLAVILVLSIAGNILMVLKLRQAGAVSGGSYNVRAGDVELSTSPRARVDV